MDKTKRIEASLKQHITFLRNLEDESSFVSEDDHLLTMKAITDALQFSKNPRDIHRFLKCIGWVEDIIEIYVARGKEARRWLIPSLVEVFIDHLICEQTTICSKMELTRILNLILEGCSLKVAQELLKGDGFKGKIESLFLQITTAGDFELQVMLIECILRLTPQKNLREILIQKMIPDQSMFSRFLNIRDAHFDVDCRTFLNKYNEQDRSSCNRIYSYSVETVKLDGEQLYKPEDEGYDDFWIDFNTGSKRISLFCQSTLLPSQLSQSKEPRWETLSLRASDVHRYNCDARNKFWVVTVELKVGAQMLTNKECEKQPHLFMCHLPQYDDIPTALDATLKLKTQKSSVPKKLFLPQNKYSSLSEEKLTTCVSQKQSDNSMTDKTYKSYPDSQTSSRDDSSQKKCSTPLEPLTIITSSISSTDGSRHISWQAIHERVNQKKITAQDASKNQMCNESVSSHETVQSKNLDKSSVAKIPIGTKLDNNLTKARDQSARRRRKVNDIQTVDSDSKLHAHQKRNTTNEKAKPKTPIPDIYQSPVTASGDFVCPVNETGISKSTEKKGNLQDPTDLNVLEIHTSTTNSKDVNNSSSKTCGRGRKNAREKTASARKTISPEPGPSCRKPGLRSGKKVMTPVVTTKMNTSMRKQKDNGHNKLHLNSNESSLTGPVSGVKSMSVEISAEMKNVNNEPVTSNKTVECRHSKNDLEFDKDQSTQESFDDFKTPTPKTLDFLKNIRKDKKNKPTKVANPVSKDLMTKSTRIINDDALKQSVTNLIDEKEDCLQTYRKETVSQQQSVTNTVESEEDRDQKEKLSKRSVTNSFDAEQNDVPTYRKEKLSKHSVTNPVDAEQDGVQTYRKEKLSKHSVTNPVDAEQDGVQTYRKEKLSKHSVTNPVDAEQDGVQTYRKEKLSKHSVTNPVDAEQDGVQTYRKEKLSKHSVTNPVDAEQDGVQTYRKEKLSKHSVTNPVDAEQDGVQTYRKEKLSKHSVTNPVDAEQDGVQTYRKEKLSKHSVTNPVDAEQNGVQTYRKEKFYKQPVTDPVDTKEDHVRSHEKEKPYKQSVTNPIFHKEEHVQACRQEKFSKQSDERMTSVSKPQNLSSLNKNKLDSGDFGHNDCNSVPDSPDSFQLCVEIDEAIEAHESSPDFVCETQFNKVADIVKPQKNIDVVTTKYTRNESVNDFTVDGDTYDIMNSSKELKSLNDTQASISFQDSYVFKKNNSNKYEKSETLNEIDTPLEDDITLKTKKSKHKNENHHEPHTSVKNKYHMSRTKQDTNEAEQVKYCKTTGKIQDNCDPSRKSAKSIQNERDKNTANCKGATKSIPEGSRSATVFKSVAHKSSDNLGGNDSKASEDLSCKRNLRTRNKAICYTERDSISGDSLKVAGKDKTVHTKSESKVTDFTFFSQNIMDSSPSPSGELTDHQNNDDPEYSFPPLENEGSSQSYRIWKSQEIKTTVTALPLNSTSDDRLADPYDFNSECMTRLQDAKRIDSFKANAFEIHNNYITSVSKPSQKDKHRKSKKFSPESTQHYEKQISSLRSTQVEFKKHIWKSTKVKDKAFSSKTCLGNTTPCTGKKSNLSTYNKSELQGSSRNYLPATFEKDARNRSKSSHLKENTTDNDAGGGIVFPQLNDPIPCTPCNGSEDDNNENSIDSASRGTQLSWIAKATTTSAQRKKMRGKTYGQNNKIPDNSQRKIGSPAANKTGRKIRRDENSDRNEYTRKRAGQRDPKRRGRMQTSSPIKNQTDQTLSSIRSGEKKTPKRKLSFGVEPTQAKRLRMSPLSKVSTISSIGYSFDSSSLPTSSKTENILRESRPSKDLTWANKIESGPSSTQRLNKSALKRKYPSITSDSMLDLSSDTPPETADHKPSRLLPRKLFHSELAHEKFLKRTTETGRSSLKHSIKASGDNLSSDNENTSHPKVSSYTSSYEETSGNVMKSRQPAAKLRRKTYDVSSPVKNEKVLKSQKIPKNISNEMCKRSVFSFESSRGSEKKDKKLKTAFKKSHLDFGFSPGIPPCNDLIHSPDVGSNGSCRDNSPPGGIRTVGDDHLHQYSVDNDGADGGDREYRGSYHGSGSLDRMDKAKNKTAVVQASKVHDAAQGILKTANSIMPTSWTKGLDKGSKTMNMNELNQCLSSVIEKAENFSHQLKEAELEATLLLTQHIQKIKAHREFSEQSLETLKCACRTLMKEVQQAHTRQEEVKESVKAALKRDFDALTHSVKNRFNEHSLDAMRRCLQASFMML